MLRGALGAAGQVCRTNGWPMTGVLPKPVAKPVPAAAATQSGRAAAVTQSGRAIYACTRYTALYQTEKLVPAPRGREHLGREEGEERGKRGVCVESDVRWNGIQISLCTTL